MKSIQTQLNYLHTINIICIPVDSSHKAVIPSLPLDKMYLQFLENLTDETISPPWAALNVLIHRLLTPSQTYIIARKMIPI